MIRKTRYFIKAFQYLIIIFTNHVINIFITKQTTLFFNNTNKLNFRFVRAFIYLLQFRLNVRYRLNKQHVLSNVLFCLLTNRFFINDDENLNLKNYYVDLKNSFINKQCFVYYKIFNQHVRRFLTTID